MANTTKGVLVLAVDVGSTSARAGVFDLQGHMLATAGAPFEVHRPQADHAEHDSEQIWQAVGMAVRAAVRTSGREPTAIGGLAFDATCSLVLLDKAGQQVTVSSTGENRWNVVMWADHRAGAEAHTITATGHQALDYVGGTVSPEMELPKLMWLQRHLPQAWARYAQAMDLADFLTWRATDVVGASACTLTCKWAYLNHATPGWQQDLMDSIGLAGMPQRLGLPAQASQVGGMAGRLSAATARAWGLTAGIAVGVPMIDAHAGALGVLGCTPPQALNQRMALIAGTSNCHMALSREARSVPGVWGPYFGAVLPGWWLNEGGQSASGALLDHVLASHAMTRELGDDPHTKIAQILLERRSTAGPGFAQDLLMVPDHHGNRAPLARSDVRGMLHGLDLNHSIEGLARLYHAAASGIAYGTRHIIDALNARGYRITHLHLTGGHAKSPLLVRLYANATACEVVLPREDDGVLLGTAQLAATAAGHFGDLLAAGQAMVHSSAQVAPEPEARAIHARGYAAFRHMLQLRQQVMDILQGTNPVG
ncbi:MAG: FGGY-family carbohydrate kinase [Burkholderiaceae bacterium]